MKITWEYHKFSRPTYYEGKSERYGTVYVRGGRGKWFLSVYQGFMQPDLTLSQHPSKEAAMKAAE